MKAEWLRRRLVRRGVVSWVLLGLLLSAVAVLVGVILQVPALQSTSPARGQQRIVSLAPALTETLFAIGAGADVIGISDYCHYPPVARERAKVGTSITPRYEAIARLKPTLIVTEAAVNTRSQSLRSLAPTLELPWLSLEHVVNGTRRLGELTGRREAAEELARKLHQRLSVSAPSGAPRVLLVLGYGDKLDEVWFIRRNSIHGAALRAAGGQNAVARDVLGQPRLSLEQVLALDPDVVMVLLNDAGASPERVAQQWHQVTPLTAVKQNRVVVVRAPEAFANGPRILQLADRLQAELEALRAS